MTYSLDEVRVQVNAILDDYTVQRTRQAKKMVVRYGVLWHTLAGAITGGKRMRPYLMVLAYELYGGKPDERVLRAAAGLEILHQAMLIHDDVIDRDYTRYGKPNVAGEFKQQYDKTHDLSDSDKTHLSHSAAILAGDLAIAACYDLIRSSKLSAADILMLQELVDEAIFTVVGGELLDSEAAGTNITDTDVLAIAGLKTSKYSFVIPLISGAKLAGASDADVTALRTFGHELGIAFQLSDDLLGVFGDETKTGKSTTSDLEEGKHTFLMQYAHAHASKKDERVLRSLFGKKNLTPKEAEMIRSSIEYTGAKKACEELRAAHATKAQAAFGDLALDDSAREQLEEIINKVIQRDR